MSTIDSLLHQAALQPTKPFLVWVGNGSTRQFSYAESVIESRGWARNFERAGIRKGDLVFICLKHRHELYFAFLGAMWLGAVPTIIPFPSPKQDSEIYWGEYRAMFASISPKALLTYGENLPAIREATAGLAMTILDVDAAVEPLDTMAMTWPEALEADDTALLQFSSGTTGMRKGVMLSPAEIYGQLEVYSGAIGLESTDVIASWLPLYHDMGLIACFLLPLHAGVTVVSMDAFEWVSEPSLLLQEMDHFKATLCWLPNFAFQHLVRTLCDDAAFDLSRVRAFINCSEVCKPETVRAFSAAMRPHGVRPEQIQCSYGMAETVFAVTQTVLGQEPRVVAVDAKVMDASGEARIVDPSYRNARTFLSCGPVLNGLEVAFLPLNQPKRDSGAQPGVAKGERRVGEILIRGDFLFTGYYRNEAATRGAVIDGWYHTGDVGFMDQGEIFICGRTKEMLIVHGRNYYANDIELIVNGIEGVKPGRTVAFSIEDDGSGSEEAIVLAETEVAEDQSRVALKRTIKAAIFDRLELTVRSVQLLPLGSLLKTTSGKLCRTTNQTRYQNRTAEAVAHE